MACSRIFCTDTVTPGLYVFERRHFVEGQRDRFVDYSSSGSRRASTPSGRYVPPSRYTPAPLTPTGPRANCARGGCHDGFDHRDG